MHFGDCLGHACVCHGKTRPVAIIALLLRTSRACTGQEHMSVDFRSFAIAEFLEPIGCDLMASRFPVHKEKPGQFQVLSWSARCVRNDRIALRGNGAHSGPNSPPAAARNPAEWNLPLSRARAAGSTRCR